jgi:hypothetical protein
LRGFAFKLSKRSIQLFPNEFRISISEPHRVARAPLQPLAGDEVSGVRFAAGSSTEHDQSAVVLGIPSNGVLHLFIRNITETEICRAFWAGRP